MATFTRLAKASKREEAPALIVKEKPSPKAKPTARSRAAATVKKKSPAKKR